MEVEDGYKGQHYHCSIHTCSHYYPPCRFLMEVEDGYKGQHYHCSIHAADVLRTLHVLSTQGGVWHGTNCTEIGV